MSFVPIWLNLITAWALSADPVSNPAAQASPLPPPSTVWEKLDAFGLQVIDWVDSAVFAQGWTGLAPDFIPEPVIASADFSILNQEASLTLERKVIPDPAKPGRLLVIDRFRFFYEVGPEAFIPFGWWIAPRAAAKTSWVTEWLLARPAEPGMDKSKAYSSDYWRRYRLPWQRRHWNTPEEAFEQPEGSVFGVNHYFDGIGGTGVVTGIPGIGTFSLNFGLETDFRRYRLGSYFLHRDSPDTLRIIQERDKGFAFDADYRFETVFYYPLRIRFFRSLDEKGSYVRDVYRLDRATVTPNQFQLALENRSDDASAGHQLRVEAEEVNHKTQASFIVYSGPEHRTNRERIAIISDTSPDPGVVNPDGSEYFHAYVSRRSSDRKAKSTEVFSSGDNDDAADFTVATSWNWKEQKLGKLAIRKIVKTIGPVLQVAGAEVPNCLFLDRKKKITGSLLVEFNEEGIRRALPGFPVSDLNGRDGELTALLLAKKLQKISKDSVVFGGLVNAAGRDGAMIRFDLGAHCGAPVIWGSRQPKPDWQVLLEEPVLAAVTDTASDLEPANTRLARTHRDSANWGF